jgi:hypothetical protein
MHRGLIVVFWASASLAQDSSRKTVWDGVYTAAQAARGQAVFEGLGSGAHCITCHHAAFYSTGWVERWREDKMSTFFDFISTRMPLDAPGSRSQSEYLDIAAYIMSNNGVPAGAQELTSGVLGNIQIQRKDGPAPLPDGTIIRAVGCLIQGTGNSWTLTKASDPVRSREADKSTGAELKASEAQPLGTRTFPLPDATPFDPDSLKGHKVEAKGTLDKGPSGERILLTALQSVAPSCPE